MKRAINPPPAMKSPVILHKFQLVPVDFTAVKYAASASTYSMSECFAADITLIRSSAWVRASDVHLQSVSRREYLITFSTVIRSCSVHYKIQTNAYLKVNSSNGVTIICVRIHRTICRFSGTGMDYWPLLESFGQNIKRNSPEWIKLYCCSE